MLREASCRGAVPHRRGTGTGSAAPRCAYRRSSERATSQPLAAGVVDQLGEPFLPADAAAARRKARPETSSTLAANFKMSGLGDSCTSSSRTGALITSSLHAAAHDAIRLRASAARPAALAAGTPAASCACNGMNGSGCDGHRPRIGMQPADPDAVVLNDRIGHLRGNRDEGIATRRPERRARRGLTHAVELQCRGRSCRADDSSPPKSSSRSTKRT